MCITILISTYMNHSSANDVRNDVQALSSLVSKSLNDNKHTLEQSLARALEKTLHDQLAALEKSLNEKLTSLDQTCAKGGNTNQKEMKQIVKEIKEEISSTTHSLERIEANCLKKIEELNGKTDEETTKTKPPPKKEEEKPKKDKEKKKLLIGILASYDRANRREAVRETWLKYAKDRESEWTYKFFLATPSDPAKWDEAQKENEKHGDIEFLDFVDSYRNLSLKTLGITRWAVNNYNFEHLMKTDDDAFVRIDRLMKTLDSAPKEKYFAGISNGAYTPDRDPGSAYYVPADLFPGSSGPNVITGAGYILSYDCVQFMAKKSLEPNLKVLPLEDVNTAVILSEFGVTGVGMGGFLRGLCPCSNDMVLTHWCSPDQLRRFYENSLHRDGNMC